MNFRPSKIDEQSIEGTYLTHNDVCYYFFEYSVGQGYDHSCYNRLILNFKKNPIKKVNPTEWRHKTNATRKVGELTASLFKNNPKKDRSDQIYVPVPPSYIKSDRRYDRRLIEALQYASKFANIQLQICECISQIQSTIPLDKSLTPDDRFDNYKLHSDLVPNHTKKAIVFDDVFTHGSHFKAMKRKINSEFPNIEVLGLFIAKSVS